MKRFLLPVTLLLATGIFSQVKTAIFAGPQLTTVRYIINGKVQESEFKKGINAGLHLKVPFEGRLSFTPGIMYNLRGYNVKFSAPTALPDSCATDNNTSFHTVELSFLLQHDFTNNGNHIFFRIGPSLDFALFGNEKFNTNNGNGVVDRNMKFSFTDYGHYLASAILQAGIESRSGVFLFAYYNYGLTTMNNLDGGPAILNRAAGISIGVYF